MLSEVVQATDPNATELAARADVLLHVEDDSLETWKRAPPSLEWISRPTATLPRHVLHAVAWPWEILDATARLLLFGKHCITLMAVRRLLSTAARLLPQAAEVDNVDGFTWATYIEYIARTKNALTDA
mmetsp:Transcript_47334/g.101042  ORF Transcript_47334/g.101042 Transcript_47334/m.101042 type:complete len:128 (-) Transcript_47334:695-1078(-)